MNSFADFTGKYSLSKTLRFELKPVGETAEHIKDFKNQALAKIVEQDKQRAEDYKEIKKLIDEYHRYFIEQVLNQEILSDKDIENAYDCYVKLRNSKDIKIQKEYEKIQDKLRNKIAVAFSERSKEYYLNKENFSKLINESGTGKNKKGAKLYEWLKDNNNLDENKERLIKRFNKFSTYFTGFNENRKNIYSAEAKSTAISYRIVHDNMTKHFNNCIRFNQIKKSFPNLYSDLENFKDSFTASAFCQFLNQTGIDQYNYEIIGRVANDEKDKRVNMFVNEYIQKNNLKGKDRPPKFTFLFKQILSDRESKFIIDEFINDADMLSAIKISVEQILYTPDNNGKTFFDKIYILFEEYMVDEFAGNIYIKKGTISNLSSKIWGGDNWHIIRDAINVYAEKNSTTKKNKATYLKELYSLFMLQQAIDGYVPTLDKEEVDDKKEVKHNVKLLSIFKEAKYYTKDMEKEDKEKTYRQVIDERYSQVKEIFDMESLGSGKEKEGKVDKIKQFLDSILDLEHFLKDIDLSQEQKDVIDNLNIDFYDGLSALHNQIRQFIPLYNKTRNYVTQKPYKTDKFKINFENSTLLNGWDVNKETDNTSIILLKDSKYYLGIMQKDANRIFDYKVSDSDSEKKQQEKVELKQKILAKNGDGYYDKMVYKLLPDPSKMLPKVIFSSKNIEYYAPSKEILDIKEKGLYKKEAGNKGAMCKWINFLKISIAKHPEWGTFFKFRFTDTNRYVDTSEFYKEVAEQGYNLNFDRIKANYINEKIKSGELYLFEIHNKDFSEHSNGKPNLHTSYWKFLFERENLDNLVLKLNGQAEIFFREASPISKRVHEKGDVLKHKKYEKLWQCELRSPIAKKIVEEDLPAISPLIKVVDSKMGKANVRQVMFGNQIIGKIATHKITKDKRFTEDKFFFHCPITLNFRAGSTIKFNDEVNTYLKHNKNINIIGIDRGERNLLYYSVIEPIIDKNKKISDGSIKELGSFNILESSYKSNGKNIPVETDYHQLLDEKERQRDEARKSWSTIENIKELKSGYLSHIVHKIAQLMIKYNAIVVLEDLNFGFKRGRFKVEKQVYQKFEKTLIDKLNYLVFKDRKTGEAGHYLNAYQLTAPFKSFQKLGKQTGFLFYVLPNYTSKIDPVTGFANLLNTQYKCVESSQKFFKKFTNIKFDSLKKYFELTFDYSKFTEKAGKKKLWTVCTIGKERYRYNRKTKKPDCYDVTKELQNLFKANDISYSNGENLVNIISSKGDKKFFESLLFYLGLTLQLRHQSETEDFILSPIADKEGNFFDSRKYEKMDKPYLPKDADANGAYNIARKGLMLLQQINDTGKPATISNTQWFDFAQK